MSDRYIFTLECSVCKNRNYYFAKAKKPENKIALNKFCKNCGKQTKHQEKKV